MEFVFTLLLSVFVILTIILGVMIVLNIKTLGCPTCGGTMHERIGDHAMYCGGCGTVFNSIDIVIEGVYNE